MLEQICPSDTLCLRQRFVTTPAGRSLSVMKHTGFIDLPLHSGKCPRWLFEKMRILGAKICQIIIIEFGKDTLLKNLANPFWFQCFGCVLGFDWHSSGLTTTVCGALKEAFKDLKEFGVYICGGKGKTSRKTPQEIQEIGEKISKDTSFLVYASKMAAKVDNNALQDGYTLYHHTFIFTQDFRWIVIQQGMAQNLYARRYHWYSEDLNSFVEEPHKAIITDKSFLTLNLVDKEKRNLREMIKELALRNPEKNIKDLKILEKNYHKLPLRHQVLIKDITPKYLDRILLRTYQRKPRDFGQLLSLENVGAKTLRALALISDLIYGESISFKDPARFSFAHGGKDRHPYKINLAHYQKTIDILDKAINKAKIERTDKIKALRRLYNFYFAKI